MIIQQPKQLKDTKRWRMVETSDEDSTIFNELCDCTLGHLTEMEAMMCAKYTERLHNSVKRKEAFQQTKCYGCKFFNYGQVPTKLTIATNEIRGIFHGTMLDRWCERPETQSEADDYNGEFADISSAEERCDIENDGNYLYFEPINENYL